MAWNEEKSIVTTLRSLFEQSVFEKLAQRGEQCEVVVVANGCRDRTVAVSREYFATVARNHPWSGAIIARVIDVPEPGKCNAWNRYVHEFADRGARVLGFMDADIVFHHPDTILNLLATIENNPHVSASTGRQIKDIALKPKKSLTERMSLATSTMSASSTGMICGQLYCVRAAIARNIYLPRGLCVEDGFIKTAICTDYFLRPSDPQRVAVAPNAAHVFEAYVAPQQVLNNQKRQMIGQTCMHVLADYTKFLSLEQRRNLAATYRRLESQDPRWFEKQIAEHLRREKRFWRLFPGILTFRWQRWARLPGLEKITHFPAAFAGWVVTLIACYRAHRALKAGSTQYWPKASRDSILAVPQSSA